MTAAANIILAGKKVSLALVRVYIAGNTLGAVYTLDGVRCSTLLGKFHPLTFGGMTFWRNGKLHSAATLADLAAVLGGTMAVPSVNDAAEALKAAGLRVKTWAQPKSTKVRVYVNEGNKDRGFLEFDGRNWNLDGVDRVGNAKHFASIAGIAA